MSILLIEQKISEMYNREKTRRSNHMEQGKIKFDGIMSAIFSVYDNNLNVIDESVEQMVNYQLNNGLKGFYVGGNTGECSVLPIKTREQMLESVVKANKGRGKIIAHIGASRITDVYELIDHANELKIDAIASLPIPLLSYYDMDEIVKYYQIISERSKVPVFAYITGVLNCDMVEFTKKIVQLDNIAGLKISVPDYYTFGRVKQYVGKSKSILNGPDESLICGLVEGADGAIGTTYNALPKLAVSIYEAFKKGDMAMALDKQNKMNAVINLFINENIAWWKALMTFVGVENMGYTVEPQRLPTKRDLENIKNKLTEVGFFDLV